MKIYLIRHGETTGDIEDRFGGSYDDHLTERGRHQLAETAKKLADKEIDIIFSSPLIRARESAQIIQQAINAPIEIIDGLKERHYGILTGMLKSEAREKYPEIVERHGDLTYTHPDGENYPAYYNRVIQAFTSITHDTDRTIAVIGHGGSLKCILKELKQPVPDIGDGHIIELDFCTAEGCC